MVHYPIKKIELAHYASKSVPEVNDRRQQSSLIGGWAANWIAIRDLNTRITALD